MTPCGYMAKRIAGKLDWIAADNVTSIYSLSNCISEDFADYINLWKHNGYWLFDSPAILLRLMEAEGIDPAGLEFLYYEVFDKEYDEKAKTWQNVEPDPSFPTEVQVPERKRLLGFDVVSFYARSSPECSPLSCNNLCKDIPVNTHCLLGTLDEAKSLLESGKLDNSEPGPFRIFAVYSLSNVTA